MRKKQWVEEQNGGHERRTSDEDVGDVVLVDCLVSVRCWGIRPFQEGKNGKGKEDEVHHVPAPNKGKAGVHDNDHLMINMRSSLTFHLERKPIAHPITTDEQTLP